MVTVLKHPPKKAQRLMSVGSSNFAPHEPRAEAVEEIADGPVGALSERQRQILEMLRSGKVNKEIATELGIGLGTVKQHVVALFKKLNVRNRTMAVSRGAAMIPETRKHFVDQGLLEYRPCVVLSLFLADEQAINAQPLGRQLQQTMAASAYDDDSIFLAHQKNGGDLIFGIQHSSESLVPKALHTANQIVSHFTATGEIGAHALRGGLAAGLAVASMNRVGGWSGEAIASTAIAKARLLATETTRGTLSLADSVQDLLRVLAPSSQADSLPATIDLDALDQLPWRFQPRATGIGTALPILGRDEEIERLDFWLEGARRGTGRAIYIEGETGMGKSRLCDHVALRCIETPGGRQQRFLCTEYGADRCFLRLADGVALSLQDVLLQPVAGRPEVWIFDDCHRLPATILTELLEATTTVGNRLMVLSGRRSASIAGRLTDIVKLARLPATVIKQIVKRQAQDIGTEREANDIVDLAMGVPLFAVELARHRSRSIPLSLRLVIGARLDRLKLDRLLLSTAAEVPGIWSVDQLARRLQEVPAAFRNSLDRAVTSGVLVRNGQNRVCYSHPLLRQAVLQAKVE